MKKYGGSGSIKTENKHADCLDPVPIKPDPIACFDETTIQKDEENIMEGIIISSDMLDSTASQVEALKAQMEGLFSAICQEIRAMNAYWNSPASQAAVAQFEILSPVFPRYAQLVENYCAYLRQTAEAFRQNEAALGAIS